MEVGFIITNRVVDLIDDGVDPGVRAGEPEDSSLISKTDLNEHDIYRQSAVSEKNTELQFRS